MYLRGKLNCSVSDEISNKIFHSLVSMKVNPEEAFLLSRQCRSIKEARSKVKIPVKKPENPQPALIQEETQVIFPVPIVPLSAAKQKIYQCLMNHGCEASLAEHISQICDNLDEAMLNAGLSRENVEFKSSREYAGGFIYKKKQGEQEKCPICLDFYQNGDSLKTLPCVHKFHEECIKRWLNSDQDKCPICLAEVKYD